MAILVIEHSAETGIQRLGQVLIGYGHKLRIVRGDHDQSLPSTIDGIDGIVTCGGPHSVTTPGDWLEPQMDLLRQAHAAQLPIIGLCLGAQIVATALGGQVSRMPGGYELGWHDLKLTPQGRTDPVLAGIGWTTSQLQWHRDEVTELPADAQLLASSERCKNQAFVVGMRTYCFQFHPEVTTESIEAWAISEPEAFDESGMTHEQLMKETGVLYPAFHRISDRLFEALSLLVMPVDRRHQGAIKDLHH